MNIWRNKMNPELSREEIEKIIKAIEEKMQQTSLVRSGHWEILIIYNEGTMDIKATSRERIREKNEQ